MSTFWKIAFIVVVAAIIIGAGVAVFNAGIAQGLVLNGQLPAPDGAPTAANPYPAPYYRPWSWGFGGFGCFGLLLLFLLLFGLSRLAFGPRHGWRRSPWGWGRPYGFNGDQVPPFVEDLHRKMHEKMNQPPTTQA